MGKIQFMVPRRPDVDWALNSLAKKLQAPTTSDQMAMKRLVRYLSGSRDDVLVQRPRLEHGRVILNTWSDADWAGDRSTRRSTTSWVLKCGEMLLSSACKTQAIIAQSSCESEYIAACAAAAEMKYFAALFEERYNKS